MLSGKRTDQKVRRIESKKHIVRKILHFFKVRMKIDFSRSVYTEILLYAFLLKDISDIESCYVLWFPFKKYKLYGDGILTGMIKTLSLLFISYWQLR